MNIDRNSTNKDAYINSLGLISPIDLDESDDVLLFEHRGKPDPRNVRKREEQKRRGELRRKNAEKRRLEEEKRKNRRKPTQKKEEQKETKKVDNVDNEKDEQKNKQENKVLSNKKIEEVKQHISDSKDKCKKVTKSIKAKNKKQKEIVGDIDKSISTISAEIEDNMNNGKDVDIDDIIDREYTSIVKKHENTEIEKEDDWGDLGTFDKGEENFAKQFDKDNWGDLGTVKSSKKSSGWEDDFDDDESENKSYYQRKLQRLQKRYNDQIDNFTGSKEERKKITEKYKKEKEKINQRIKETEIENWQGYKEKRQQQHRKKIQELKKNPVVNWIRMSYFKCLYPLYKTKETITKGINWLYGFDD